MKPHELLDQAARLLEAGLLKEAQRACRKALQARPDLVEAHLMMSEVHRLSGDRDKALASTAQAQRLAEVSTPTPRVLANLGHVWAGLGRAEDAAIAYRGALARDPALSDARTQLLRLLRASDRFAEMEAVAREGRSADPASLFFLHQLAVALWWLGRHGEAVDAFGAIEGLAPDRGSAAYSGAKLDQASVLLALGRWREGWAAYRWRASRASWRAYVPGLADDPAALGEGARRILVIGEQGLGDEVFFLRFASRLRAAGHRLIGRYDRRLLGLLQRAGGGLFERLLALDDPQAVEADVTLLAGDLPIAHGGGDVPAPFPLQADAARRAALEARLRAFGPPPYVGVTWRAGALPEERTVPGALYLTKEVPLDALGRLLRPLHASVVIVQRRPFDGECQAFRAALGRDALDLSAVNDDLEDALAALSLLDEYVGVSNTNTHLRAGCARRPARVLVYAVPEWRWGVRGDRSPWFPDARVYRARPDGSWAAALESLGTDLSQAIVASQHAVG